MTENQSSRNMCAKVHSIFTPAKYRCHSPIYFARHIKNALQMLRSHILLTRQFHQRHFKLSFTYASFTCLAIMMMTHYSSCKSPALSTASFRDARRCSAQIRSILEEGQVSRQLITPVPAASLPGRTPGAFTAPAAPYFSHARRYFSALFARWSMLHGFSNCWRLRFIDAFHTRR